MLAIRDTAEKGRGVFADAAIPRGTRILWFTSAAIGPLDRHLTSDVADHANYLQVGLRVWLKPVGIGFLVNHSCEPNCVVVLDDGPHLETLVDVAPGEEITYDYSLTATDDPAEWTMPCFCGAPSCRGSISGYPTMPELTKARYRAAGLVPGYVE